jgi:hypothetical protein
MDTNPELFVREVFQFLQPELAARVWKEAIYGK